MLQVISIIFGFLSALILVSFDIPFLSKFLEKILFKNLNDGFLKLKSFNEIPEKGPRRSIIKEKDNSFLSLLVLFKSYFPDIINKHRNQKIIEVICESALSLSSGGNESILNPICLWFKGENSLTSVCSLNELRVLIRDYKQRFLNRCGLFFLFLTLIFQILSIVN